MCTALRTLLSRCSGSLRSALSRSTVTEVVIEVRDEPELLNADEMSPSTKSRLTTGGM